MTYSTAQLRATVGAYPAIVVAGDAGSIADAIAGLRAGAADRAALLEQAAQNARARFSPDRFDCKMAQIFLSRPPLGRVGKTARPIRPMASGQDEGGTPGQ